MTCTMFTPRTIFLDTYILLLLELGIAVFTCLILYLIHVITRYRSRSKTGEAVEMYLGGESPRILKRVYVPVSGLYWGFVRVFARRVYFYIRHVMHNGVLATWATYMAGWFGFLMVLTLIAISMAILWR